MPPFVICYICGRQYGTHSIDLHEPKCLEKWHVQNNQLPKNQRKKPPVKPNILGSSGAHDSATNMEEYNRLATSANLYPCSKCGRTFFQDRLEVHERSCKGAKIPTSDPSKRPSTATLTLPKLLTSEEVASEMNTNIKSEPIRNGPITVICYICGRQYGRNFIDIHEPKCLEKWRIQNNKLPVSQRRPTPVKPSLSMGGTDNPNSVGALEEYNQKAMSSGLDQLSACPTCNRRFKADRLEVHIRGCKPNIFKKAK